MKSFSDIGVRVRLRIAAVARRASRQPESMRVLSLENATALTV